MSVNRSVDSELIYFVYSIKNVTCKKIPVNNSTFITLQRHWEAIPETIVLHLVLASVLLSAFIILRHKAWNNKSRHLSRTKMGWLQFLYGHRDADIVKPQVNRIDSGHHVHDSVETDVIFPPVLYVSSGDSREAPNVSDDIVVDYDSDCDSVQNTDTEIADANTNLTDPWKCNPNVRESHKVIAERRAKLKSEYDNAVSRFAKTNSTDSISRFGYSILNTLLIRDKDILRHKGNDALQYLMFQRYIIYFMMVLTFISLTIALPVNINGGNYDDDGIRSFAKTTINNVRSDSPLLWVHAVLAALIIPIGLYIMHHFSHVIKADEEQVARRTLMIRKIPKSKRNKQDLIMYFQENFPDIVIEGVQFIYDIAQLMQLEKQYKNMVNAKLYCIEYQNEYNEKCEVRPYTCGQFGGLCCCCPCCPKVDGVKYYGDKEREMESTIKNELKTTIADPTSAVFVTFQTEQMTMDVYKRVIEGQRTCFCLCNCFVSGTQWFLKWFRMNPHDQMKTHDLVISYAPYPDDVNWVDLSIDYRRIWLRKIGVNISLFVTFFFLSTPSILLKIFEFIMIQKAVREGLGGVSTLITEFLSPLIMGLMVTVLPFIVEMVTRLLPYKTLSELNHAVMWKVFVFLLMMVIILPSAGFISINAFMDTLVNQNASNSFHWECIFPVESGAFFVNYVIQETLTVNIMELLRIPELAMYLLYVTLARSQAEYEDVRREMILEFPFGVKYARFLLIFSMVATYSLAVPLIAPIGLVYICVKHLIDRYNIYYVFSPGKIGGKTHSTAVLYIHIALLMLQFQIFSFFLMHTGYTEVTGFSMIILMSSLLIFSGHCFFHWFRNINHLAYTVTTRLTKKVRKHEHCACAYVPPLFDDLITEKVVTRDSFTSKRTKEESDVSGHTSTEQIHS